MELSNNRKVLVLTLLFAATLFTFLSVTSALSDPVRYRRLLLTDDSDIEEEAIVPIKKKTTISSLSKGTGPKNNTKSLKPSSSYDSTETKPVKSSSTSNKNPTKLIKPISSSLKNKTKAVKSDSDGSYTLEKPKLKKLNSTSKAKGIKSDGESYSLEKSKLKKLNSTSKGLSSSSSDSTKSSPISTKKSLDPLKSSSSTSTKIKSSKSNGDEKTQLATDKITKKKEISNEDSKEKKKTTSTGTITTQKKKQQTSKSLSPPSWFYNSDEDDDLVSEFRDLPSKFQKSFIPDLQRISSSSQIYFSKANKEMTKNFKPYVGNKYAPSIAITISCVFIIIPFLLVSLLFSRIKAYFSLQKLLIFIQIYLSIYFTILCLSSLITGLEPLKFFYATSQSTYIWLQVLQTLGYVLYLLLLLMYLILVFSTDTGLGSKFLGLAQTFVGFAVGLHYYMTVFHRVVLRQPPKTNWKVHAVYATCFLVICLLAGADRRKKAYMGEGGEDGKNS